MGNEQLTEPGRSSAVDASLQPPETVGSGLCDDPTRRSDRLAAHSVVEQQQRIRASCQASLGLPISHQRDKVGSDCGSRKPPQIISPTKIAFPRPGKPFFANEWNRGIPRSKPMRRSTRR